MAKSGRLQRGRRRIVSGLLSAPFIEPISAADGGSACLAIATARDPARVAIENRKRGARDWQLTRVRPDSNTPYRNSLIEGYCSRQSVRAGESIEIMVSTLPPSPFLIEIFRMGYYGGLGARLMTTLGPIDGTTQPAPPIGGRRLRECQWQPAARITIPDHWTSGVYLGRRTRWPPDSPATRWQSYVVFIVRDDRPVDILFQCSDNTWAAYNRWPDNFSLYTSPNGPLVGDVDVSFDRPYGKYCQIFNECPQSFGSGEFLLWEYPLCFWLEQHGYDVSYCSNSDMLSPERVLASKAFLSVGHDEYWDLRQYESVRAAIDSGVCVLFLSGNAVCFVAPFRQSATGQSNRIISRAGRYGGVTPGESKYMGPFVTQGPNERYLIGARTIEPFNGGGDWVVAKPDHWILRGTGMKAGDAIPGLVGWEFHGDPGGRDGLEIVAEGDALNGADRVAHWTATVYPGPRGNYVFNASTIWWAQGLSSPPGHMLPWSHWVRPHGPDPRVAQITRNLLERAINRQGAYREANAPRR